MAPTSAAIDFSQVEAEILMQMAMKCDSGSLEIMYEDILEQHEELDRGALLKILDRFIVYGLVTRSFHDSALINPRVMNVVEQLQNPPPPDYWQGLQRWVFSSKWRVGLVAFGIVLPLVVQWVEMMKSVVSWIAGGG